MAIVLLKTKEVSVEDQDGTTHRFLVSRLPAVEGREIVTQYPISAMPKVGDYKVNEAIMLKLMSYVAVVKPGESGDNQIILTTKALVNNHIPDWEVLAKVEMAMMEHNVSFFRNGRGLTFFEAIARKVQASVSPMLTDLLAQLSKQTKPP